MSAATNNLLKQQISNLKKLQASKRYNSTVKGASNTQVFIKGPAASANVYGIETPQVQIIAKVYAPTQEANSENRNLQNNHQRNSQLNRRSSSTQPAAKLSQSNPPPLTTSNNNSQLIKPAQLMQDALKGVLLSNQYYSQRQNNIVQLSQTNTKAHNAVIQGNIYGKNSHIQSTNGDILLHNQTQKLNGQKSGRKSSTKPQPRIVFDSPQKSAS